LRQRASLLRRIEHVNATITHSREIEANEALPLELRHESRRPEVSLRVWARRNGFVRA
jgi:hypothetical protein